MASTCGWIARPSLASVLALLWTAGWLAAGRCCGRLVLGMAAALALRLLMAI
jgi:hypothetical protein